MHRALGVQMAGTPWFRSHRRLVVAVAFVLYGLIFATRLAIAGEREAISALFVLPIALLAVSFGLRAGVAGGLLGVALVGVWVVVDDVTLTPLGWLTRIIPLLLIGILVGEATDRLDQAASATRQLQAAKVREREAAEINDSIIQGIAVAKWQLESGDYERSIEMMTETMETAQRLVSDLLSGRAITPGMFRRSEPVLRENA